VALTTLRHCKQHWRLLRVWRRTRQHLVQWVWSIIIMYIGVRGVKTSKTHHAREYGLSNNISPLDRTPPTYFSRKTNYKNRWVSPRFVNATIGDLPSPSTRLNIPRCTGYMTWTNTTLCIKGLTAHITQTGELTYVGHWMSYKHPKRMIYEYITLTTGHLPRSRIIEKCTRTIWEVYFS